MKAACLRCLVFSLAWLLASTVPAYAHRSPTFDAFVGETGSESNRFGTIAAAIEAAPGHGERPYRIFIAPGDYYEKLVIDKPGIQLIGAGQTKTRIHYDAYAGQSKPGSTDNWSTWESATLIIRASDILVSDLHIENSFDYPAYDALPAGDPGRIAGTQAVAVMTDRGSDRVLFERVTFSGYQDTLFALSGRSLFRNSVIKGHVDFIFGAGTAVFMDSDIVTRPRQKAVDPIGYVTAPSTPIDNRYGLVFINCRLLREAGVEDNSMALGRPWHPTTTFADGRYADPDAIGQAVFINCWMDGHIKARAWYPMGGTLKDGSRTEFQPEDARFFEYGSRGPGARQHPIRRQLGSDRVDDFKAGKILGDWWPPASPESSRE